MVLLVVAAVLVLLSGWRFWRRVRAEARRQVMLSWPRVPVRLFGDEVRVEQAPGRAPRLANGYYFFARGREVRGQDLIEGDLALNHYERRELERFLGAARSGLTVSYDPRRPERNFLFVGHSGLRWWNVAVYLFFGVALPAFLLYLASLAGFFTALNPVL